MAHVFDCAALLATMKGLPARGMFANPASVLHLAPRSVQPQERLTALQYFILDKAIANHQQWMTVWKNHSCSKQLCAIMPHAASS